MSRSETSYLKISRFVEESLLSAPDEDINSLKETNQLLKQQHTRRTDLMSRYGDESYYKPTRPSLATQWVAYSINRMLKVISEKLFGSRGNINDYEHMTIPRDSNLLFVWNWIVLVAMLYNFYEIPVSIFFTQKAAKNLFENIFWRVFQRLNLFFILVNILVNSNLRRESYGKIITGRSAIVKIYFRLHAWIDLSAWLALLIYVVAEDTSLVYLRLLFYAMGISWRRIDSLIKGRLELYRVSFALFRIFSMVVLLVLVNIWIAGIFFALDYQYYESRNKYYPIQLWLTNSGCTNNMDIIQTYDWPVWLIYSLYWVFQTVSFVGFGDLTPRNPVEVIYCDLVVLTVSIIYALFINSVWDIIRQAKADYDAQGNYFKALNSFYQQALGTSKTNSQQDSIQNRTAYYLMKRWKVDTSVAQVEQIIREMLSPDLREELLWNYKAHFFKHIPLMDRLSIFNPLNEEVGKRLLEKTTQVYYGACQTIYSDEVEDSEASIYSLLIGKVVLSYRHSNYQRVLELAETKKSKKNTLALNFGVFSGLTRLRRDHIAICSTFCKTSSLTNKDLVESLRLSPSLYNRFCELLHELMFLQKYELTGQACYECGEPQHHLLQCPWGSFNLVSIARRHHQVPDEALSSKFGSGRLRSSRSRLQFTQKASLWDIKTLEAIQLESWNINKYFFPKYNIDQLKL